MQSNYSNVYLIFLLALTLCLQIIITITNTNTLALEFNANESTKKHVDWAFSPVDMTYLAKEENIIYTFIQKYRKALKQKISLLESYTHDYIESTKTDEVDDMTNEWNQAKAISGNPLMTYRMIGRFAYNLNEIINDNTSHIEKVLLDKIQEMNYTFNLPTWTDLEHIMDNIFRIQNVYKLRTKDLLHGIIGNKKTGVGFTIGQAYELGKHAISKQIYTEGLDWLQNVMYELRVNPYQNVDIEKVYDTFRQLIKEHDDLHDKIRPDGRNFFDLSMNRFTRKINSSSTNVLVTLQSLMKKYHSEHQIYNRFRFMDTCNGINVKTPAELSKLYCYYDMNLHHSWKINPLKIEVHSWDPYVIQIFDVIGHKTIEYLKNISLPTMKRATITNYDEGTKNNREISTRRTCSYSFIGLERNYKILLNLNKKIGFMTGLKVDNIRTDGIYDEMKISSEPFQVATYGFGGHFDDHFDALQRQENETASGDRIATFMLYLNDVESGGYTAFTEIKLAVPPVKGSAIFWYNLMKNGVNDQRTKHGGCPVILGEKWIANKWIRHNGNFQKRPCSLDPLE